jgi:hypothetical protein
MTDTGRGKPSVDVHRAKLLRMLALEAFLTLQTRLAYPAQRFVTGVTRRIRPLTESVSR